MASISEPVLDVRRAMTRYGWYGRGTWRGFMMWYAFLCIDRMVPPEQRFVFFFVK